MSAFRTKPYSEPERTQCRHCGKAADTSWATQFCAENRRKYHRPLCWACDEKLNEMMLTFFKVPGRGNLIRDYRRI